jgi:hypothetical protein
MLSAKTLEKQEHERQLLARIAADIDEYYEAMKQAAVGATHLIAGDADGTWKEVTDPQAMVACLNNGKSYYRLSARNPDVRALINLLDRLCGSATDRRQVEVTERVTLEDLVVGSRRFDT